MSFGYRLRNLREQSHMTQTDLADKLNLSKANISKYESNLVEPNLQTLSLISELFDVSVDYLLGKTDDPNASDATTDDDDIKFALFKGSEGITDEMYEEVKRFAAFVREREKEKNKDNN